MPRAFTNAAKSPRVGRAGDRLENPLANVPIVPHGRRWWQLLLVVPFIALLWVPFYNSIEPELWGIPFFYWYQFLWVILTSALIVLVHHRTS
jgi:hypothetical protein